MLLNPSFSFHLPNSQLPTQYDLETIQERCKNLQSPNGVFKALLGSSSLKNVICELSLLNSRSHESL
ncbi:hypothetical protein BpHYR1_023043 [Brachionus plicatilis]|uniref:Uncharacterized protein n=1 Tax=Brachionus plicatilis TaxID=10195 RepID=A0A3M7QLM7_BRAPC|nr:hypothetical protein BpHYR1_023043 [Brachionus plicatilis]